jgi:hypothetical protein
VQRSQARAITVTILQLPIAALHFVTGSHYQGPCPVFVNGYLLDVLIPFGFYFLLSLPDSSALTSWAVRAGLIFGAASLVEFAQFLGAPVLGRTCDPLDLVAYGAGVLLAAILDRVVFARVLWFWSDETTMVHRKEQ